MGWLMSQTWLWLAITAVLGLVLGVVLRGVVTAGKFKRAAMDLDLARAELNDARSEIDELYAAQRKLRAQATAGVNTDKLDALTAEITAKDIRIAELGTALSEAHQNAQATTGDHHNPVQTAETAIVTAVADDAVGHDENEAVQALKDRNVWLEERVATLESDLEAAVSTTSSEMVSDAEIESPVHSAKLEWQNTYLRQRVEALEDKMQGQNSAVPVAANTEQPTPATESAPEESPVNEIIARLRWRNRYLESRIAYYESSAIEETEIDE